MLNEVFRASLTQDDRSYQKLRHQTPDRCEELQSPLLGPTTIPRVGQLGRINEDIIQHYTGLP